MQRFARVRVGEAVIPVILNGDAPLDLHPIVADITPETIASGALVGVDMSKLPPITGDFTYVAPIAGVQQIAATGFNYKKHIEELHVAMPTEPEVFLKAASSLTGPFDPIHRGPYANIKLDWEVELGIVIGRETLDITAAEGPDHIFGYVCINDISNRATQIDAAKVHHLVRAKSRPTYAPIGPFVAAGIDPMHLDLWTKLNGHIEQQGNTSDMIFDVYEMVAYFSKHMKLFPGDILATGTPPGVGLGKNRFMVAGDVLECGITHLGAQQHEVIE
jgi:2,4-didehydro-3-deoxy-L-rhamnonate hydrolase